MSIKQRMRRTSCRRRMQWWIPCILWLHSAPLIYGFFPGKCSNGSELRKPFKLRTHIYISFTKLHVHTTGRGYQYDPTISLGKRVPPSASVLSEDPLVYVVPNFLSEEECDSYMERVRRLSNENRPMTRSNPPDVSINVSKLWPLPFLSLGAGIPPLSRLDGSPSMDQLVELVVPPIALALVGSAILALLTVPLVRLVSDSSSRTSVAMALNLEQDIEFIRPFVDRVCHITQHPWHAWESPVCTKYEPGAIFAKHGDASPTRGSEWSDMGGQRVITCICYLNTVNEGGETSFDQLGINVKPTKGTALVFFPANVHTLKADERTTHESLPPVEEKWIVQMFGRVGRVPPPLGLPDLYGI